MLQQCLEALKTKNDSVDDDNVSIAHRSSQFFFLIRSSFVNPLNPPQQWLHHQCALTNISLFRRVSEVYTLAERNC